jgi:hypothetical protein
MNWWDFVNVFFLCFFAQHTVLVFFSKQYYYHYFCTVIFIDMFVCVRLFDMMVDGVLFLFYRYYSANGKMENCTSFFSFLFFFARDCFCCCCFVVVPLRPCLLL